ncbi:hypothetical protein RchiOBHm_Chr5g0063931 [Rosa chinensis]|uniref:Uncharacterized protein n=1 Tax=Rosa chinensis TaxID=74649 RepID=A0A2P6QIK3_ROSCH|nr:hypothetical protein RchiOBHm_Chr5g0063931 [Rosa chinensis]
MNWEPVSSRCSSFFCSNVMPANCSMKGQRHSLQNLIETFGLFAVLLEEPTSFLICSITHPKEGQVPLRQYL